MFIDLSKWEKRFAVVLSVINLIMILLGILSFGLSLFHHGNAILSGISETWFMISIFADLLFWLIYWLKREWKLVRDLALFVCVLGLVLYLFSVVIGQ